VATVITDKLDYAPGSTANITAEGFTAGSKVEFLVQHVSNAGPDGVWGTEDDVLGNNSGSGHEPWYVIDGGDGDLDGLKNGVIKTTWFVNPDDSYMEKFLLTAIGDNGTSSDTSDDQKAITTFTDGQLALWSWRNQPGPTLNSWDAGTTIQQANSVYAEDEVIPFRWTSLSGPGGATDLKEGVSYTIQLDYAFAGGTTYPDKFFFDYLTSYNKSESTTAPFGPGSDLAGFQTGNLSTVAIPNDPHASIEPHAAGNFTLFNILASSVTFGAYTADPVNSTQEDRRLNITFIPDDGDAVTGETLNVGVAWGGHLAASSFYGAGKGAADFPGASPQMVVDLNPDKSGELSNININPNAIVGPGQITVIKDAVPLGGGATSPQDFVYTITGPNGFNQTFTLDDDGGADAAFNNQQVFFGLAEGVYTITESAVPNWLVSNITAIENGAEDTTSSDIFSADLPSRSIQITLANGEAWTTTFDNTQGEPPNAVLTIDKVFLNVTDGNGNELADSVGDVLNYKITITNDGNVPLTGVTVKDPLIGLDVIVGTLDVGQSIPYIKSYTLTQADIDGNGINFEKVVDNDGDIDNTATADSNETGSVSDSAVVPLFYNPALAIDKVVLSVEDLNKNGLTDAGDKINYNIKVSNTGNVTLTGVSVVDPLTGQNISAERIEVGTFKDFGSSYLISQDDVDGNGGGDGDIDNTATADSDQTESKSDSEQVKLSYKPLIDVEKYISVDGKALNDPTKQWEDADSPTGPTLTSTSGINPVFKFVVVNTGNVTLNNVTLTDDVFNIDASNGDKTIDIGSLAVGDGVAGGSDTYEYIYTDALWKAGQHVNTATADSTESAPDTDKAYYYGTMPAMVTNSSLCDFGDKFNLIFTPDFKNGSGNFKLSDSNPGQYYYNMFDVDGTAGETNTYSFEIPKEFTAQGAVPIHIYDQWNIVEHNGQMCIEPVREIANQKLGVGGGVTITDLDGDGNNEYTFDATFSETGMLYLNMHLDFAAEKQTGWIKGEGGNIIDGEDALDNPNYDNPNFVGPAIGDNPNILEGTKFNFSALINGAQVTGSADTISNDNIFKNIKGMGGLFQADNSSTIGVLDEIPVAGQHLIMKDSKGAVMGDAVTDADGWYFAQFMATGKATDYKVYWDKGNDNSTAGDVYKTVMMGGSAGKWAEQDWTVVDIVGYNPSDDLIINSYGSIL